MDDIFYPLHSFKDQFLLEPEIINKGNLIKKNNIIICGMGGSAISVSLLKILFPELPIALHNGYGAPDIIDKDNTLIILNSYSGNTEEILDVLNEVSSSGVPIAAISCGGELIRQASLLSVPHIVLPSIGVEPRFAIGHQILSLLALLDENEKIDSLKKDIELCDITNSEKNGKQLASNFTGKYPILYASKNLYPVAYLIKAAINEGSKMPCFVNTIPEANHNEIQAFISNETKKESGAFMFTMFISPNDHPRVLKRFKIMSELYSGEGFDVATLSTDHTNRTHVFELILIGYFAATYFAIARNVDSYKTPFIKEFKERML
ncbi:SIS domain-containing protein [Candidatus Gracilibacteria bacterium]|nr:SIS domain-containing protein [Candidatus Gracilibacteria bacterium]MCF7898795.1 SIS domain-containing protein [Candidatus Paceibacterota bacterium]